MFVSLARVCVVYLVKELRHSRVLGQLMDVVHKRTRTQALVEQKESCVAYVETGTYSKLFYLKYIPKVLQEVNRVDNNYNRLMCFRHDKISHDY